MEESTDDISHSSYSPSLKHRLKNSLYACFKNTNHNQHHHLDNNNNNINSPQHQHQQRTLLRSTSGGATGMMRHIMNRIGTPRHGHHHRKSKSTDFRYDPHSYTLNFDDDDNAGFHEFPFRDFTSRLPHSPRSRPRPHPHPTRLNTPQPPPPASSSPREIVACS